MSYKPVLADWVAPEWQGDPDDPDKGFFEEKWAGARFLFVAADKAEANLFKAARRLGLGLFATPGAPPELFEELAALFIEGVIQWEGVMDGDGEALACDDRNKRLIPTFDKVSVAWQYFVLSASRQAKKAEPAAQPT